MATDLQLTISIILFFLLCSKLTSLTVTSVARVSSISPKTKLRSTIIPCFVSGSRSKVTLAAANAAKAQLVISPTVLFQPILKNRSKTALFQSSSRSSSTTAVLHPIFVKIFFNNCWSYESLNHSFSSPVGSTMGSQEVQESMSSPSHCRSSSPYPALVLVPPAEKTGMSPMAEPKDSSRSLVFFQYFLRFQDFLRLCNDGFNRHFRRLRNDGFSVLSLVLPTVERGDDDHALYSRSFACKAREYDFAWIEDSLLHNLSLALWLNSYLRFCRWNVHRSCSMKWFTGFAGTVGTLLYFRSGKRCSTVELCLHFRSGELHS